jgi:hypothetical protein
MTRLLTRAIHAGRIRHSFAIALVVALALMPAGEALAYFIATATGTGQVTNVQAGAPPTAVVTIAPDGAYTYAGPSTSNLMPGGTVSFAVRVACVSGCPALVTTISLADWSSDKAGCDPASMPSSFTMPALNLNTSIGATSGGWGPAVITWTDLSTNQNACAGANFTFTLVTP